MQRTFFPGSAGLLFIIRDGVRCLVCSALASCWDT